MAPEVFVKKNVGASPSQDIWALGCILYALVFGKIPFRDKSERELKRMIVEDDPVFPDEIVISDELKNFMMRLLEKNPEQRANIYEITHHPWYKGKKFDRAQLKILAPKMDAILEDEELKIEEPKHAKVKFLEPVKQKKIPNYMKPKKRIGNAKRSPRGSPTSILRNQKSPNKKSMRGGKIKSALKPRTGSKRRRSPRPDGSQENSPRVGRVTKPSLMKKSKSPRFK